MVIERRDFCHNPIDGAVWWVSEGRSKGDSAGPLSGSHDGDLIHDGAENPTSGVLPDENR